MKKGKVQDAAVLDLSGGLPFDRRRQVDLDFDKPVDCQWIDFHVKDESLTDTAPGHRKTLWYHDKKKDVDVFLDELVIHAFGITAAGHSIHLEIQGFKPHFYVNLPPDFKSNPHRFVDAFRQWLSTIGSHFAHTDLQIVHHQPFFFFNDGKTEPYLRIGCLNLKQRNAIHDELVCRESGKAKPHPYFMDFRFDTFEFKLPPVVRLFHQLHIKPMDWVHCEPCLVQEDPLTNARVLVHWQSLHAIEPPAYIAPLILASFDIECWSESGDFPVATLDNDKVIQVSVVLQYLNFPQLPGEVFHKTIFVLDSCEPIEGARVVVCHTEAQLLSEFAKYVRYVDPDVLVGYNIHSFDWDYLQTRAKKWRVELMLSRLQESFPMVRTTRVTSRGERDVIYVQTPGRVQFDMLNVIQNDEGLPQLVSYSLEFVSTYYLNQHKNDVSPHQMWVWQQGSSEDRKRIAEYCLQDSVLPLRLLSKLDMFLKKMGMAQVCWVPLAFILLRGQSVKAQSLVTYSCHADPLPQNQFVIKDLFPAPKTKYAGAIVLKPRVGAYMDPVAVNDFNSLYPSASISHNLCPSKLVKPSDVPLYASRPDLRIIAVRWRDCQRYDPDEWKDMCAPDAVSNQKGIRSFFEKERDENPDEVELDLDADQDVQIEEVSASHLDPALSLAPDIKVEFADAPMERSHQEAAHMEQAVSAFVEQSELNVHYFVQPTPGALAGSEETREGRGIVPRILLELLRQRKIYKKKMEEEKDPFQRSILDALQLSYKITANSIYGQMGTSTSAIRCLPVAASITAVGRMQLLLTRQVVRDTMPGAIVVYGDTDSVFVKYPVTAESAVERREQAKAFAEQLEERMASLLPWPHRLAYEKVYDPFLLVNKKRYSAPIYENDMTKFKKVDTKGMSNKRRDFAKVAQTIFSNLLRTVHTTRSFEAGIQQVRQDLMHLLSGQVPLEDLVITKSLRSQYKTPTPPCHKALRDRMFKRDPGSAPHTGDRVPYVFVKIKQGKAKSQGDLVEHPDYIKQHKLQPDYVYYVEHQIKNAVEEVLGLFAPDPWCHFADLMRDAKNKQAGQASITSFFQKK